jgi:hypothetical protein
MKKRHLIYASIIAILIICVCFSEIVIGFTGITTYIEDTNSPPFEQINRIWEMSQNNIDLGNTLKLNKSDLIKITAISMEHQMYVKEVKDNGIELITLGNQTIVLKQNDTKIFEIINSYTNEHKLLELTVESIEGEIARLHIQTYDENKVVRADYVELFDIAVELPNTEIYSSSDLNVYIKFFNFGDGPSQIDIEYAVKDMSGKEYYRGIDNKVVYTEDAIIKNFNFLDLAPGNYTITSEIFYGKNQTAYSEKTFVVLPVSQFNDLLPFSILALVMLGLFTAAIIVRFHLGQRIRMPWKVGGKH